MDAEALSDELDSVLERARGALAQEISTARTTLQKIQREIADAGKTVTQLADQKKQVEADLSNVMKNLQRASTKVSLDHEIAIAKAELKQVQAETEKASKALEKLTMECANEERKLDGLRSEVRSLVEARSQTEARMRAIREQLSR